MKDKQEQPSLERITVKKSYDVLAGLLRETILSGQYPDGSHLPSERELVDQTGLSRGSIREAIRKLEAEGLVKAQPGRFGGNIVRSPTKDVVANSVAQFVRGRRISNAILQQSRETLEPALCRLAALNRTEEDLAALDRIYAELQGAVDNPEAFTSLYIEMHNTIARASHNDLLAAFQYSMSYGVLAATVTGDFSETHLPALHMHARIIAAIRAKDPDAAFRRMERHLKAVSQGTKADSELEFDFPGAQSQS